MITKKFRSLAFLGVLAGGLLVAAESAVGSVHFALEVSTSENNIPLSSQNNRSVEGSVAVDLATYFRLGLTHRQAVNKRKGYVLTSEDPENPQFVYRFDEVVSYANSVDLTIILYAGELLIPFLKVGIVKKDYVITAAAENEEVATSTYSQPPVPNGGIGLGIRLNRNFSLKISYTVSPGLHQQIPGGEQSPILDTYTSVGLSYNI